MALGIALGCTLAMPARAQFAVSLGGGWAGAGPPPGEVGLTRTTYQHGSDVRFSIAERLAPRFAVRVDGLAASFGWKTTWLDGPYISCLPRGTSCNAAYTPAPSAEVYGGIMNAVVDLDTRRRFYVVGGIGAYGYSAPARGIHTGLTLGTGVNLPVRGPWSLFGELDWERVPGHPDGPAWMAPITFGLRFEPH